MIALPGDIDAATLSGIILDEAAIGVFNNKTTAVRVIPCREKGGRFRGFRRPLRISRITCTACPDGSQAFVGTRRPHPRAHQQFAELRNLFGDTRWA